MLKRFFKKEKAKVYLGCIAVAPRSDIKRHLDQWGVSGREDLDTSLRLTLGKIFDLPDAKGIETPTDNDLGLDIVIHKFQSGDIWDVSLGNIGFPLAWRPKIEISSRLYSLKTGKTVHTVIVLAKMPWRKYFSRLFTWRAVLRFKPMFDSKDMNNLLVKACMQLLVKLRKIA